jgi:periplasmic divalent cation tolerance protein
MNAVMVYVTTRNPDEAKTIGGSLVEKQLAACVNIIPHIQTMYRWKGVIERGAESILIAKTRDTLIDAVIAEVKKLHGYEVPCIVALPIVNGNPAFLQWIYDETITP